jgi:hypothetical protein
MKTYGGGDVQIDIFLSSARTRGKWSALLPGRFTPRGKSPRYQLDRRWGGPQSRSGRRGEENILDPTGTPTPPPRRPGCSQSSYRLRYGVSHPKQH